VEEGWRKEHIFGPKNAVAANEKSIAAPRSYEVIWLGKSSLLGIKIGICALENGFAELKS